MLETALRGELRFIEKHLQEYPDYCILNLCRLIYSFETKDVVVSKAQTAEWACNALPDWRRGIELAIKSYNDQATPKDRQFMLSEVRPFLDFARTRIEHASKKNSMFCDAG